MLKKRLPASPVATVATVATVAFVCLNVLNLVLRIWYPEFKVLSMAVSAIILILLWNRFGDVHTPYRSSSLSIVDKT